jgi:hypothetical protein
MQTVERNLTTEWSFTSARVYADPFNDVDLDVIFTDGSGAQQRVPAFWAGGDMWRVRFATPNLGGCTYRTVCSNASDSGLSGQQGSFEVVDYTGSNPLYKHGAVRVAADHRHFEHADGTPFLWLADTEWMGLVKRLDWPDGFQLLVADRVRKGFNVVQIVAGLYPDMPEYDERGANEAGFPWEPGFARINPAYFDMADRRIEHLVESGLAPCIVGCWGYFLAFMGAQKMKQHWRYLIARYGSYPVIWCAAGEAIMAFYTSTEDREAYYKRLRTEWTKITRYIRATDPYQRLVSVHPGCAPCGFEMVDDAAVLDFDMLQTGHSGHFDFAGTLKAVARSLDHEPKMPVINSEVNYEGILEMNREEIQRLYFWSCVLAGAAGHTYGANGIWQVNTAEHPLGPSPHGVSWGDTSWQVAAQLPGSTHLGVAKRILERYPWWEIEPHQEWIESGLVGMYVPEHASFFVPRAAGTPGKLRLIYTSYLLGALTKVTGIEPGVQYRASYVNPSNGSQLDLGAVTADESGDWRPPTPPIFRDWVLILES